MKIYILVLVTILQPIISTTVNDLRIKAAEAFAEVLFSLQSDQNYLLKTLPENSIIFLFKNHNCETQTDTGCISCNKAANDFNSRIGWDNNFFETYKECHPLLFVSKNINFLRVSGITLVDVMQFLKANVDLQVFQEGEASNLANNIIMQNQWGHISAIVSKQYPESALTYDTLKLDGSTYENVYAISKSLCGKTDASKLSKIDYFEFYKKVTQIQDRRNECYNQWASMYIEHINYMACLGTSVCTKQPNDFCDLEISITTATNEISEQKQECDVKILKTSTPRSYWKLIVGLAVGLGLPFLIVIGLAIYYWFFREPVDPSIKRVSVYRKQIRDSDEEFNLSSLDSAAFVKKSDFSYSTDNRLGSGEFADVYKATLKNKTYAAKLIKNPSRKDIVPEINIGYLLRGHENLLGVERVYEKAINFKIN